MGTLTNQIPASSVHKARKVCMVRKVRKACKACKVCMVHKAHKACKVVGKISGFYVNEVFHFH